MLVVVQAPPAPIGFALLGFFRHLSLLQYSRIDTEAAVTLHYTLVTRTNLRPGHRRGEGEEDQEQEQDQ